MKIITIGSDPEFFVLDPKGKPFPATLFATGTKDLPVAIKELDKGFFEQRDNLSFEGNIPACTTKEEFCINMGKLRDYFVNKVSKKGYSLSPNGVEYFVNRYLQTVEGMEFGCSKVVSAWDSNISYVENRPTPILDLCKFRVAGFHIHIGYNDIPFQFTKENLDILIARLFDLFVTSPSQKIKPEPERIKTYGRWGMIRMKLYGVECRTLSSYFTQTEWLPWVWDQTMKIESFINSCNLEDLITLIKYAYILGDTVESIEERFAQLFKEFSNKEPLKLFNETKYYV